MRPLGGIAFGIYGDKVGRKRALSLAMLIMALGSGIIAWLTQHTGDAESASYCIIFAAVVSLLGMLLMKPYRS